MIKSRERKNSRNQKQEQETTNQPQISKQKHNCLLFCWPSPLLLLSIWLKGGIGRAGVVCYSGISADGPKAVRLFCRNGKQRWHPPKNLQIEKFCCSAIFSRQWGLYAPVVEQKRPAGEGRKVAGIEPCRSELAVCWATARENNAKWNWHKSFVIVKLNKRKR